MTLWTLLQAARDVATEPLFSNNPGGVARAFGIIVAPLVAIATVLGGFMWKVMRSDLHDADKALAASVVTLDTKLTGEINGFGGRLERTSSECTANATRTQTLEREMGMALGQLAGMGQQLGGVVEAVRNLESQNAGLGRDLRDLITTQGAAFMKELGAMRTDLRTLEVRLEERDKAAIAIRQAVQEATAGNQPSTGAR